MNPKAKVKAKRAYTQRHTEDEVEQIIKDVLEDEKQANDKKAASAQRRWKKTALRKAHHSSVPPLRQDMVNNPMECDKIDGLIKVIKANQAARGQSVKRSIETEEWNSFPRLRELRNVSSATRPNICLAQVLPYMNRIAQDSIGKIPRAASLFIKKEEYITLARVSKEYCRIIDTWIEMTTENWIIKDEHIDGLAPKRQRMGNLVLGYLKSIT